MEGLAEYIICVCCAALLCGIVGSMMPKGTSREILRLVGGLFLAFTVIRPVSQIELPERIEPGGTWQKEASEAVSEGEEMARQAAADGIKKELEAYILDKAQTMQMEVRVQLILNMETLHPDTVTIIGNAAPNPRERLIRWVCQELGLTEEDVTWIS